MHIGFLACNSVEIVLWEAAHFRSYGYREIIEEFAFANSCYHNSRCPLAYNLVFGWISHIRNCGLFRLSATQGEPLKKVEK
jgi:hypothetical protein